MANRLNPIEKDLKKIIETCVSNYEDENKKYRIIDYIPMLVKNEQSYKKI